MAKTTKDAEIASLRRQLRDLEARKSSLEAVLAALEELKSASAPTAEAKLLPREKIALFRRLFAGRPDIFALRWENRKDGRSGYAPACANEWVAGVCGKPKIKCGACPNQAFLPVTDDAIGRHLRGSTNASGRNACKRTPKTDPRSARIGCLNLTHLGFGFDSRQGDSRPFAFS